ncbi:MAG: hypothetical protein ACOC6P_03795 [Candidatus Aminicenantaceae bacterium]
MMRIILKIRDWLVIDFGRSFSSMSKDRFNLELQPIPVFSILSRLKKAKYKN